MEEELLKLQKHIDNLYELQNKLLKFIQDSEKIQANEIEKLKKTYAPYVEFVDFYGAEVRRLKGLDGVSFLEKLKKKFPDLD